MLKLIRKNSKDDSNNATSRNLEHQNRQNGHHDHSDDEKTNFFSLPAELRNEIYSLLSLSTHLTLQPNKGRYKRAPPPALLLTSRQARQEYHPLLLCNASITAKVKDLDFREIARVTSSLYSAELKALRVNPGLKIRLLHSRRPKREDFATLRRWLVRRAEALDRCPWSYEVGWKNQSLLMRKVIIRELVEGMKGLMSSLEEALAWELMPLYEVYCREEPRVLEEFALSLQRGYVRLPADAL